jgi:hypothetical protein
MLTFMAMGLHEETAVSILVGYIKQQAYIWWIIEEQLWDL